MSRKLLVTFVVGCGLLVGGCGKKSDAPVATGTDTPTSEAAPAPSDQKPELGEGVKEGETRNILDRLSAKFPQIKVSRISKAPVDNFYQLSANGDIIYVSTDGNRMFVGDLLALDQQGAKVNLTEEVRKESRLNVLNSLSESDMVVFEPKGKPEYTVTVFTDIDCGYCRKFHQEIQSYLDKNIKVRYLSFPRAGKDSDSYNKAKTVWCSKDRKKAMDQAKLTESFKAADKLCSDDAVDRSLDVVRQLGLNGTPAILAEDGTLLPGYMPADALAGTLAGLKKNQAALAAASNNAG